MWLSKRDPDAPTEILNWRLWYGVFVFGLMGAARGLDEGLTGTTASLKSYSTTFGLKDPSLSKSEQADRLSNITSMVQMGSILGALVAFYLTDKIGRLWATRELCLVWICGTAIYLSAASTGHIGMVYAGRFIMGVGIGQTTVVAPTYLAEVAPRFVRGLCVCMFSGSVYFGIMLGYFSVWGSSLHISNTSQMQWVVPNLLHIYFAGIIALLSCFATESPRWLVKVDKQEKAMNNLSKLRNLPTDHWYVQSELMDINDQLNREKEATLGSKWFGPLKELVMLPSNRYRLMLSAMTQILGQWSGANSITIYAPEYFAMMGTTGSSEKLFATAIFGVVKFVSSMICAFFLIDYIGRKKSLVSGITIQFVSMLYMAIFLVIDTGVSNEEDVQTKSEKSAAIGAIVMIYVSGFGWALGWNSVQYLINSEIYPLRLRAIGGSFAMTFHFVNQYGNSKAVPEMFLTLTTGGTMFFFAAVTLLGLAWVYFFLPELSGKSLEAIDAVFDLPWTVIGRKGKDLTVGVGSVVEAVGEKGGMDNVEHVTDNDRKV
ncbi:hypothetical protein LTR56_006302 [Elasticomyces elasticus]|nr:hypothetical protein LTR56_006302 [Elasticomyces elasticus]KAK4925429.1 hypothetical protein LTR49_007493 [Elasticomyces elasticus]KAK5764524.1 hypothetical protein LTS12_005254 [Elasticomyces elasticus]